MNLNTLPSGIVSKVLESLNFIDLYLLHQINRRFKSKIEEYFNKNKKQIKIDNKPYIMLDIFHGNRYIIGKRMYMIRIDNDKFRFSGNIHIENILPENILHIVIRKNGIPYYHEDDTNQYIPNDFVLNELISNKLISNAYKYIGKTVYDLSRTDDEYFYLYDITTSTYPVLILDEIYEHYIEYPSNDLTLMNIQLNLSDIKNYLYHPLCRENDIDCHIEHIKHLYVKSPRRR
jgi:hypothetical protein